MRLSSKLGLFKPVLKVTTFPCQDIVWMVLKIVTRKTASIVSNDSVIHSQVYTRQRSFLLSISTLLLFMLLLKNIHNILNALKPPSVMICDTYN